jgi:hypothetical protein
MLQLVPSEHRDSWRMHRVTPGETLASISRQYSSTNSAIMAANRMTLTEAREGDRLLIPVVVRAAAPVRRVSGRTAVVKRAAPRTTTARASGINHPRSSAVLASTSGQ